MTCVETVLNALRDAGCDPRSAGDGWTAKCPAHDDHEPSLSVDKGDDGRVLVHCHAGCDINAVVKSLGIELGDLFNPDSDSCKSLERGLPESNSRLAGTRKFATAAAAVASLERSKGQRSDFWVYHDSHGEPVGGVVRWDLDGGKKDIRPVSRIDSGWVIGAMPKPAPLYALPDLSDAETVFVLEGEKCAQIASRAGLTATTSVGGSDRAAGSDWSPLSSKHVVVLPDMGDAGQRYADDVAELVTQAGAASVRIVTIPGLADGEDIADFVDKYGEGDLTHVGNEIRDLADKTEVITESPPLEQVDTIVEGLRGGPRRLGDLGEYVAPEWLWHGYVAAGHMTMLAGYPKAGKSTLLSHVLRDLVEDGPLAGQRLDGPVLVVSEESENLWKLRRDELNLPDSIEVWPEPVAERSSFDTWCQLASTVADMVKGEPGYKLVVFDTLAALWPVSDENSAPETTAAMTVLRQITQAGAGLLLVHHTRKGEGTGGRGARGSSAIAGCTDINVELGMLDGDEACTKRTLTARGRLADIPHERILDLDDDGYRVVGSRAEAAAVDRAEIIEQILADASAPLTAEAVVERWPETSKAGLRTIRGALNHGHSQGKWNRSGTGVRGDAYVYSHREFDSGNHFPIGLQESESSCSPSLSVATGSAKASKPA